jgi:hypothetical protein
MIRLAIGITSALAVGSVSAEARPVHERHDHQNRVSTFDGGWSVVIQTESGACDPAYRFGVGIVNGVVTYEGNAYGQVRPNGAVQVQLSLGDQHAEGTGRLSRTTGAGFWRGAGSAGACSGRWFAERRPDEMSGRGN